MDNESVFAIPAKVDRTPADEKPSTSEDMEAAQKYLRKLSAQLVGHSASPAVRSSLYLISFQLAQYDTFL